MFAAYNRYAAALGRLLMCAIFLLSGFGKVMDWDSTEAEMHTHGMTVATNVLLAGAIAVEILGGVALLLGYQVRIVAVVLFLFLIPTTLLFHNFWAYEGMARQMQLINFLKNLAILGGLLELSVAGAGGLSLDALQRPGHWPFRTALMRERV